MDRVVVHFFLLASPIDYHQPDLCGHFHIKVGPGAVCIPARLAPIMYRGAKKAKSPDAQTFRAFLFPPYDPTKEHR